MGNKEVDIYRGRKNLGTILCRSMTKEELASKAVKKAREEAAADLEKVKAQAQHFQSLFTDSTIAADLTRAAQESGAYSPGQVHVRGAQGQVDTDASCRQHHSRASVRTSFSSTTAAKSPRISIRKASPTWIGH